MYTTDTDKERAKATEQGLVRLRAIEDAKTLVASIPAEKLRFGKACVGEDPERLAAWWTKFQGYTSEGGQVIRGSATSFDR